jgi:hypothetical protein
MRLCDRNLSVRVVPWFIMEMIEARDARIPLRTSSLQERSSRPISTLRLSPSPSPATNPFPTSPSTEVLTI